MMRRVSSLVASTAVIGSAADAQVRTYVPIKSKVEYRIPRLFPRKSGKEANDERLAKEAALKHPNPSNKKEALQHLTERPAYEYVSDYQRAANDMMAVYDSNGDYGQDMQYHYHKLWKAQKRSGFGREEGICQYGIRVAPGNQQL